MARTIAHWSPRYIYDRVAQEIYFRRHPQMPWFTRHAIDFLQQWLQPEDTGFEWGSGRSTIWFSKRIKTLTSVEHETTWHGKVQHMLAQNGLSNVQYELHPVDSNSEDNMSSYVRAIAGYPDANFDFILVDGVQRHFCALIGLSKLKPGGLMVIDNANWYLVAPEWVHAPATRHAENGTVNEHWQEFEQATRNWRKLWTSDGVTATMLCWKKI